MKLAIKYWRKRRGMTQQEFARRIGKSRPMIPQYEQGHVGVSSALLYRMAQVLEVGIAQLYDEEKDPCDATDPSPYPAPDAPPGDPGP